MKTTELIICLTLLCSCVVKPFGRTPSGEFVSLGGSLATKSEAEDTSASWGNYTLNYKTWNHDEQAVPLSYIRTSGTKAVLTAPAAAIGSGLGTVLKK